MSGFPETWPDGTPRTPGTVCWHCDRLLDAATDPTDDTAKPEPGAVSFCFYCGAIGIFGPELLLYPPSKEVLDGMESDVDFLKFFAQFQWARQYVIIEHNLMRSDD
jgi:hypothetical protein